MHGTDTNSASARAGYTGPCNWAGPPSCTGLKVLHSVAVGIGCGDIDHVLIGPPGVVTINTKHHRAGRLTLDGDELVVNGRSIDAASKARREVGRAEYLLMTALTAIGYERWPRGCGCGWRSPWSAAAC